MLKDFATGQQLKAGNWLIEERILDTDAAKQLS
jgi:hypothetical protein